METQLSILLFNLILNIIIVLDHFINRIRTSSCYGITVEMKEDKKKDKKKDDKKKDDPQRDKKDENLNILNNV